MTQLAIGVGEQSPMPTSTPTPTKMAALKGTFTVVLPNGERRTIRIDRPTKDKWAGWIFFKYLYGPDNEKDYRGFAYKRPDEGSIRPKLGFEKKGILWECLRMLALASQGAQAEMGLAYAIESGNCYNCNRKLTVPTSVHRGLGPDCAKRKGVA